LEQKRRGRTSSKGGGSDLVRACLWRNMQIVPHLRKVRKEDRGRGGAKRWKEKKTSYCEMPLEGGKAGRNVSRFISSSKEQGEKI